MNTPSDSRATCLILFPGALGDFLCFLPTADAIRTSTSAAVTLVAHGAHGPLVADRRFEFVDIDRREVSALFSADCDERARRLLGGFARALSWTGHGDANFRHNLTAITDGPTELFHFNGFRSGLHAVDHFAQCAGVAPSATRIDLGDEVRRWARDAAARLGIDDGTLLIHAGSGSPRKNWEGMSELARVWRQRGGNVVALVGPADRDFEYCDAAVSNERVDRVAALLELAPFFIGNDSGISHLAGAVACPGVVVFGDTDPTIWRPRHDRIHVMHATRACATCGPRRFCTHRLDVCEVLDQVDRYRSQSYRRRA